MSCIRITKVFLFLIESFKFANNCVLLYFFIESLFKELKEEYEKRLREIQKEADAILTEAGKKARIREARILEEARREAAGILKRADREIELEKQKAMDEMKQEMISIASLMAGRAVAAAMNTEAQNRLIEETLKEIDESTWEL